MTVNKDIIEMNWIQNDLNVIASETGIYKAITQDFKDYRTVEHIISSSDVLSNNQNFKLNLEQL